MSIDHYPKPEVGMEVCLVITGYGKHRVSIAKIVKVGRKWVTLDKRDSRFNIENWIVDSGQHNLQGRCYPNKQAYIEEMELSRMLDSFVSRLSRYHTPKSVTVEAIKQAEKLLGLES